MHFPPKIFPKFCGLIDQNLQNVQKNFERLTWILGYFRNSTF
ncbi:hypothetical protein T11_18582 [Trichinella zimbabwensis]|uniref:Uncharacterized protein n=1 Tax=Trichinella zimbabwensis TaxID=268475 RepID=A0A0V1GH29_9BILA|nr:hypothetical protein T11_6045 [Trichinella zimbabwensis]KRY97592.1 hypothetical protein T11_11003 [Trichinella zimbabwensis]KRY97594.1 hypothetical protein T11_18582 [Trichinella zimbabwensis]